VINLREFTTTEGFEWNSRGNHMLYIGVDAKYFFGLLRIILMLNSNDNFSAIISQCMSGAHAASPYGPGGMHLFFYKLCFLIRYPATWIFVFNGQLKAKIKRDIHVIPKNPQWAGPCKRLLEIFGFTFHEVSVFKFRVLSYWPLMTYAPGSW
jgi:hypothetical protein